MVPINSPSFWAVLACFYPRYTSGKKSRCLSLARTAYRPARKSRRLTATTCIRESDLVCIGGSTSQTPLRAILAFSTLQIPHRGINRSSYLARTARRSNVISHRPIGTNPRRHYQQIHRWVKNPPRFRPNLVSCAVQALSWEAKRQHVLRPYSWSSNHASTLPHANQLHAGECRTASPVGQ